MSSKEQYHETPPNEGRESAASNEAPQTVTLGSRDVTKYHAGQRFDNGEVRGKVGRIDYGKSTIEVELDDEGAPEERKVEKGAA